MMELNDCFSAFKRYIWLIIMLTVFSAVSAWAVSHYLIVPLYESEAMVIVSQTGQLTENGIPKQDALLDSNSIQLFYNIAESNTVAGEVISSLGLDMEVKDMQDIIDTQVDFNTGILHIKAETDSPELSRKIVNTFIGILGTESKKLFLTVNIHVVDAPKLATKPSTPNIPINVGLSALGGMLTGMLLSILFSIKEQTKTDLYALGKLPWLFVMGFMPKITGRKHSVFLNPAGKRTEEAVRVIRANLSFLMERDAIKTVMITSPRPSEGKTSLAVHLAASMAQAKKSVLLVDCNLNNPSFFKICAVKGKDAQDKPYHAIDEYVVKTLPEYGIDIAMAPRDQTNIKFNHLRPFFESMGSHYDLVLVDCPPVLTNADTMMLTSIIKNVILLADYRVLSYRILEKCISRLTQINASILGIVINRMPPKKLL